MKKIENDSIDLVELPKELIVQCFTRLMRPGQDPTLKKLMEVLVLELSHSPEKNVNSFGIYMALCMGCLTFGNRADEARKFLPMITDLVSKLNHPEADRFVQALRKGVPGIPANSNPKPAQKGARRSNVNSRKY